MTWPAINRHFSQEGFRLYLDGITWGGWRPSKVTWHNTAAPSLAQWIKSANQDRAAARTPGISRIRSLTDYFQNQKRWPGCPHLFIANDFIWVMNPLTAPGTHSPSWNGTAIGIEMVGDFSREDDDTGDGLKVKNNTIFATAMLCAKLGLDPASVIYLHKQDPRTTHDCPGKDIAQDKTAMIAAVADLMAGGEHNPEEVAAVIGDTPLPRPRPERSGLTNVADLNLRRGPGVENEQMGSLPIRTALAILDTASNSTTAWLKIRTPAGYIGWVAARFVTIL